MKKLIYLFLIINLQFSIFNLYAQWLQQTSGVSAGLTDVQFINENTGWACGDLGTIVKTTNGGLNWSIQSSGVTKWLFDIQAIDSEFVYCIGQFETILKSTNGGNTWIIIRNGPFSQGKTYRGLHFINRNSGWICGVGQWVLKTTNGCVTFDSNSVGVQFAWDIYFKDNINGLIAGQTGTFFKSTNSGVNWTQINVQGETADFFELSFIGDIGWIIGLQNRKVYKSTNYGTSWDSIGIITGTNSWLSSIFFSSFTTGWVCGDSGKIYKSTNGGVNWYQQVVPLTVGYGPSYFINDTVGWAVGSIGTIIHTITGGQIVGINPTSNVRIEEYSLFQNFPNPFNTGTSIKYQIANSNTAVKITVFDIRGREINVLVNRMYSAGKYEVKFNSTNLPSGIYFYRLSANGIIIDTKKMILVK